MTTFAPPPPPRSRRTIGALIRAGLVVLAVVIGGGWLFGRLHSRDRGTLPSGIVHTEGQALQPGDVRIVSRDGNVSVTLQGDRILTGLSPEKVAEVRAKLEESAARDTSGLGAGIAQMVKKTVADNISRQLAYPIADVSDVTHEDGRIVLHMKDGKTTRLFESTNVDGERPRFSEDDARGFIEAFRARKTARP